MLATGETAPYAWSVAPLKGLLPPGLIMSSTGVIAGTPTLGGTFNFSLQVTDSSLHAAQKGFSITISPAPLSVATATLKAGVKGTAFSQQLVAGGGTAPYRWSLAGGQLPDGLSLDSSTGLISGIPAVTGTFGISVSVSDATSATAVKPLQIEVISPDSVPQINLAKYKGGAKLIVRGAHFDSGATLVVDGSAVKTVVQSDEAILSRGLSLSGGTHQLMVVNSNGVTSSPFSFTL